MPIELSPGVEYDDEIDFQEEKHLPTYNFATKAAEQTLEMHDELMRLRRENAELRQYRARYLKLLNEGVDHGRNMMAGLLGVGLKMAELRANQKEG